MKYKKQIKQFLESNYTMICSLMTKEESERFHHNNPVDILIKEIDRQLKEENK